MTDKRGPIGSVYVKAQFSGEPKAFHTEEAIHFYSGRYYQIMGTTKEGLPTLTVFSTFEFEPTKFYTLVENPEKEGQAGLMFSHEIPGGIKTTHYEGQMRLVAEADALHADFEGSSIVQSGSQPAQTIKGSYRVRYRSQRSTR
ncbi:hypothetical protein CYL20_12720 [Pseudomonas palleroniana]|uniref:Uncharacterized protein n=1 Tax=Pseudomonas palleroniana TaxID=191390 RepID=A0A2L1JA33_9PSED|nr:hypothetical protein [Pseudomonas palleroniana]AVE05363.1 hypothetical protein CYL20_12720 [Pseudomonas palleroniana]UOK39926.1 hypothetical protein MJP36_08750 [Pseudomonas palleroniana]